MINNHIDTSKLESTLNQTQGSESDVHYPEGANLRRLLVDFDSKSLAPEDLDAYVSLKYELILKALGSKETRKTALQMLSLEGAQSISSRGIPPADWLDLIPMIARRNPSSYIPLLREGRFGGEELSLVIFSLGEVGCTEASEAIYEVYQDNRRLASSFNRMAAMEALARMKYEPIKKEAIDILRMRPVKWVPTDSNPQDAPGSEDAAIIDLESKDVIVRSSANANQEVPDIFVYQRGGREGDFHNMMAQTALMALGCFPSEEAVNVLLDVVLGKFAPIENGIALASESLGAMGEIAVEPIIEAIQNEKDVKSSTRRTLLTALGHTNSPLALDVLVAEFVGKDEGYSEWHIAMSGLVQIEGQESDEALLGLAKEVTHSQYSTLLHKLSEKRPSLARRIILERDNGEYLSPESMEALNEIGVEGNPAFLEKLIFTATNASDITMQIKSAEHQLQAASNVGDEFDYSIEFGASETKIRVNRGGQHPYRSRSLDYGTYGTGLASTYVFAQYTPRIFVSLLKDFGDPRVYEYMLSHSNCAEAKEYLWKYVPEPLRIALMPAEKFRPYEAPITPKNDMTVSEYKEQLEGVYDYSDRSLNPLGVQEPISLSA